MLNLYAKLREGVKENINIKNTYTKLTSCRPGIENTLLHLLPVAEP